MAGRWICYLLDIYSGYSPRGPLKFPRQISCTMLLKGNVRVYIERMLMSARYYSIANTYKSIFEINLQFVLIL